MKVDPAGRVGRFVQRATLTPAFRRVGPVVLPRLDRVLHRVSGGRLLLSQAMIPTVMLVSTGAKTGQQRRTPLATMPDGDVFWLVGSNFGRQRHPAWTANLAHHAAAEVVYRGRTRPVTARQVVDEELAGVWPRLVAFWPSYQAYTEISGHELRVFRLDPR
jgi:deazaflavin-dependent oxidoreductase (nitroreductase family)